MDKGGFRPTENYIAVDELNSSPSLFSNCAFFKKSQTAFPMKLKWWLFF